MLCRENGFLVDQSDVGGLDLRKDMFVNMIVIPFAGVVLAGLKKGAVIQVIAYRNDGGLCDNRCVCNFLCLLFFQFLLPDRVIGRFLDQPVIQLLKKKKQNQKSYKKINLYLYQQQVEISGY